MVEALDGLSRELRELDLGSVVPRTSAESLTPLVFYRDFVAPNKPVVIEGALAEWPAIRLWNRAYLEDRVTVALTPNGRADAVQSCPAAGAAVFAQPAEQVMQLRDFVAALCRSHTGLRSIDGRQHKDKPIMYAQKQSDSLAQEFAPLVPDIAGGWSWANEAFGCAPDASNVWVGDERSVTSFHKDHYENMYAVIQGTKTFTLLPPCEVHRLYVAPYQAARYVINQAGALSLELEDPARTVRWSPLDPCTAGAAEIAKFPLYYHPARPLPFQVSVRRGEVLYLPSMWYHYVQQEGTRDDGSGQWCPCIAVNIWYDMKFDCKYAYAKFIEDHASCLEPGIQSKEPEEQPLISGSP